MPATSVSAAMPMIVVRRDRLAVDLGGEQLADEVVAGLGLRRSRHARRKSDDAVAALATDLVVGELEDVADPAGERVATCRRARRARAR